MSDKKEKPFDLEADPFETGFEFDADVVDTDNVIQFFAERRKLIPENGPVSELEVWKATCKAAIKCKWFRVPNWNVNDVNKWHPGQTRWLAQWVNAKYEDMIRVPFD